jgi:hypothetical protein
VATVILIFAICRAVLLPSLRHDSNSEIARRITRVSGNLRRWEGVRFARMLSNVAECTVEELSSMAFFAIVRAMWGYCFLIFIGRIVGRRPGKQLTPFEYVLIFYLGGLTLTDMVGDEFSLTNAICQIMTVAGVHWIITMVVLVTHVWQGSWMAFFFNAVFFSYGLVGKTFFQVADKQIPWHLLPFTVASFLGPLTIGHFFDTVRSEEDDYYYLCGGRCSIGCYRHPLCNGTNRREGSRHLLQHHLLYRIIRSQRRVPYCQ